MTTGSQNKVLLKGQFSSFEEFAEKARQWDTDFRQVSTTESEHELLQVLMGGTLISRARFGCHVQQFGATPVGTRTFAILEPGCEPVYWFGRSIGPGNLLIFPESGEIDAVSRPGFSNHTFCVNIDELAAFSESVHGPDIRRLIRNEAMVIPLQGHQTALLMHFRKISFNSSKLQQSLALYDAYTLKLFDILLGIFIRWQEGPNLAVGRHHPIIKQVIKLVESNRHEEFSISRLCSHFNIPERTLNAAFNNGLGISPASFIKGLRLFGAHRELWHADASTARVTAIATSWGFYHPGQFSADYRRFFGELPKQTLKRTENSRGV